ncbi:DUF397 domain-containing protein [Streptomyces sp. AV19]|uniref:DUF397 domain-containing protein n=1 Tax=Streptomyces sp. AV19 TaxID=2793068 RepID=UPI0018FE12B5|nr:DUF397 domain-containing protein [Streptomyces sp. AV19]MBH1937975.1 DUF397 domain-containing protein [Streptomyces sp. AV19]MDG4536591.1 DUF397 domain-containing protein [Streptomyces sp. AV19]
MSAPPRSAPSRPASCRARWRRSSHSTGMNNCVEATALGPDLLAVRDSKRAAGPALLLPPGAWCPFVARLRGDGFTPSCRRS